MKFALVNMRGRVVYRFEAVDVPDARQQVATWVRTNQTKVILCAELRMITPQLTVNPPTVDDQEA